VADCGVHITVQPFFCDDASGSRQLIFDAAPTLRREEALLVQVSGLMAAAASGASSKAGAARAAASAFEDNGDLVQQLGWAHVDALSLDDFVDELSSAPASSASALEVSASPNSLATCSTVPGSTLAAWCILCNCGCRSSRTLELCG
jgi:hypothetical protein